MSNLEDLQGRILAAMDRIGYSLERLEPARPAPAEGESAEELGQLLAEERTANAQLEERLRALHDRQDALEAELAEARAEAIAAAVPAQPSAEVTGAMAVMEAELERLRAVNDRLRDNNRLLREANGAAGAELLEEGMAAELEALRADHAAARAEAGTILAALEALVGQVQETEIQEEGGTDA